MTHALRSREAETPGTFLHDAAARWYREHVRVDRGCWGWSGPTINGYARVALGTRGTYTHVLAHRLSYVVHHGEIAEDLHVLHSCDNPICTNPVHLRLGTQADNMDDKFRRGRASFKVPPEKIDELLDRVARGELLQREAGAEVGVSQAAVSSWLKTRRKRAGR